MKVLLALLCCVIFWTGTASGGGGSSYGPYYYPEYRSEPDTFGDAFRQTRDAQVLNPDAGRDANPVEGMDGPAAERAYGKYLQSLTAGSGCGGGNGATVGYVPMLSSPVGGGK